MWLGQQWIFLFLIGLSKEETNTNSNSSHGDGENRTPFWLLNNRIEKGTSISVLRPFPSNSTPNQLMKMQLIMGQRTRPAPGEEISPNHWLKPKKAKERIGSYWLNSQWYIHQYCPNHRKLGLWQFSRSILSVPASAPHLWNSSVNVVRGEDKKWSDPHTEPVEVILITLAFISAGWLKMIRVPELKLILKDWLSVTRVWHNRCKWSRRPGPVKLTPPLRAKGWFKVTV